MRADFASESSTPGKIEKVPGACAPERQAEQRSFDRRRFLCTQDGRRDRVPVSLHSSKREHAV